MDYSPELLNFILIVTLFLLHTIHLIIENSKVASKLKNFQEQIDNLLDLFNDQEVKDFHEKLKILNLNIDKIDFEKNENTILLCTEKAKLLLEMNNLLNEIKLEKKSIILDNVIEIHKKIKIKWSNMKAFETSSNKQLKSIQNDFFEFFRENFTIKGSLKNYDLKNKPNSVDSVESILKNALTITNYSNNNNIMNYSNVNYIYNYNNAIKAQITHELEIIKQKNDLDTTNLTIIKKDVNKILDFLNTDYDLTNSIINEQLESIHNYDFKFADKPYTLEN